MLDTQEYKVQLEDGTYDSYFANIIAKNLYSQCNAEGREFNAIREIVGHKTDGHAIAKADGYTYVRRQQQPKKTTAGWHIEVAFSNGMTAWLPLKDVKERIPIELAEYAVLNR